MIEVEDDEEDRKPAARDHTASDSNPGQGKDDSDVEFMGYVPAQPNQPVAVAAAAAATASNQGQGNEDGQDGQGSDPTVESNAITLHESFPEWQIDDIQAILLQNGNDTRAFMEFVREEPRGEDEDGFVIGSLFTARSSAFRPIDNEVPAPRLHPRQSMGEPPAIMPSRDSDDDVDVGLANEMGSKMSVSSKSGSSGDKKSAATYATPQDGNKRQAKKSPQRLPTAQRIMEVERNNRQQQRQQQRQQPRRGEPKDYSGQAADDEPSDDDGFK